MKNNYFFFYFFFFFFFFYNVLGKQIKAPVITRKALDISALNSGVYILKITENNIIETRKLVIK